MSSIEVRYNYRLRMNVVQQRALKDVFDACRAVWNRALGDWSDEWKAGKHSIRYREADQRLIIRRKELAWLRARPSVPQQQIVRDLYKSISAFFDKSNSAGRPTFKKKGTHHRARWTKNGFALKDGKLHVAVAGERVVLRVVWSRPLPSDPTSVTVYLDRCGRSFASFVCRIEVPDTPIVRTGRSTGLDVGLTTFATVEDEEHDIANPRHTRQAAKALARSQRNVASKHKGSKNRTKARWRLRRESSRVARQRLDFQHKAARELVANYDRIGVEDLRVKNMMRKSNRVGHKRSKSGLNRAIADASWSQFIRVLEFQAKKAGTEVVKMPATNTTQRCSERESITKTRLELSDRIFRCSAYGFELARDRNAAKNLNPGRTTSDPPAGLSSGRGVDGNKTKVPAGTLAA